MSQLSRSSGMIKHCHIMYAVCPLATARTAACKRDPSRTFWRTKPTIGQTCKPRNNDRHCHHEEAHHCVRQAQESTVVSRKQPLRCLNEVLLMSIVPSTAEWEHARIRALPH